MSTSHHPQTDGQTERANRTVEDMLRAYVAPYQTDWDEHLVAAEFAYNNSVQASTGFTPFYLNHGRHPHTPLSLTLASVQPSSRDNNPAATDFVGRFQSNLSRAKDALHRAQKRQQKYADQKRRDAKFSAGDMVLLSTQNLTLKMGENTTPKLCPKFIGPFKTTRVLSPVAYQLQLPNTMKCHNVFHISLLKKIEEDVSLFPGRKQLPAPPPVHVDSGQAYFIVDYIMGHEPKTAKSHEETKKYLIKWEGYPLWEATKEPARNIFKDVPLVVKDYWESSRKKSTPAHQQQPSAETLQQSVSFSLPLQVSRRREEPPLQQQDYQRPARTRKQPAKLKDSA